MLLGNLSGSGRRALARDRGAFCAFADVPREAREHLHRYSLRFVTWCAEYSFKVCYVSFCVLQMEAVAIGTPRKQYVEGTFLMRRPAHRQAKLPPGLQQGLSRTHAGSCRPRRARESSWARPCSKQMMNLHDTQVPEGQGARARAAGRAHVPARAHRLPAPPQGARRQGRLGRRLDRQRGMPWL